MNESMEKVCNITYDEYQCLINRWKNNNDFREINIQNEVIKPFIQSICVGLDVIDISNKGPKSQTHDYLKYCGVYEDRDGNQKPTTPDLVVADGWNWANMDNKVNYLFVIEVKSPFLRECIYNKDDCPNDLKTKIARHLSAKENQQVLLTDGIKWVFYKETLAGPKEFCLYEYNMDSKEWNWKQDSNTFNELKEYIEKFCGKNFGNAVDKKANREESSCNYFVVPINVALSEKKVQWNYFKEMQTENAKRVETFLYKEPMKSGDYVLLYITNTGLKLLNSKEAGYGSQPGVYAIGRILSSPPKIMLDESDRNFNQKVVDVDIEYYDSEKPIGFFADAVKPKGIGPFLIKDINKEFLDAFEKAKCNATFKPFK